MADKLNKENLLGKYILIGITFVDSNENVIEKFQTHGRIIDFDPAKGITIKKANEGNEFCIPPHAEPAEPGIYTLKNGDIVTDPDFLSTYTLRNNGGRSLEDIKELKQSGFKGLN